MKNLLLIGLLAASSASPFYTCNGTNAPGSNNSTNANISPSAVLPPENILIFESNLKPNADTLGPININSVENNGSNLKFLSYQERFVSFMPQFSPDKAKIIFWSNRPLNNGNEASPNNLWNMNTDGSNPQFLTQSSIVETLNTWEAAQFSPDGRRIIFISSRNLNGANNALENPSLNIWSMNSDGSDLRALTNFDLRTQINQLKWSPDGSKIAFLSNLNPDGSNSRLNNVQNIWMMQADGSRQQAVTRLQHSSVSFYDWSNDSSKFALSTNVGSDGSDIVSPVNISNIWTIQNDGTQFNPLTRLTHGSHYRPLWSPDGKYILYISNRNLDGSDNNIAAKNLWAYKFDGNSHAAVTRLTFNSLENYPYEWSKDSTKILFLSNRHLDKSDSVNTFNISNFWMMNPDGTDLGNLTGFDETAQAVGNGNW